MSDTDKSIERVLQAYAAAVHAKDVDAFMRLARLIEEFWLIQVKLPYL